MPVMGGASPSGQGLRIVREPAMPGNRSIGLFLFVTRQMSTDGYGTGHNSAPWRMSERSAHVWL